MHDTEGSGFMGYGDLFSPSSSYSNLRNVCMFVCVLTPPRFIDLRAPNLLKVYEARILTRIRRGRARQRSGVFIINEPGVNKSP